MASGGGKRPLTPEQRARVQKAAYEVGFGKTSKETQFRPGESGNPSGRPKGKSTGTLLRELLNQSVPINLNGESQTLTFREALVQITGATGLKGGPREREHLLRLIAKYLPEEFEEPPQKHITPDHAVMLERFKKRLEP